MRTRSRSPEKVLDYEQLEQARKRGKPYDYVKLDMPKED